MFRRHTHCRVCGTTLGAPYLDVGMQPLANALVPATDDPLFFECMFPLQVALCTTCGLSQLTVVVDPSILYSGYRFRSGASAHWRQHCNALADQAAAIFKKPGVVIDIAANDGTQLVPFYERSWHTIGVEPAEIPPVQHLGRIERAFWSMDVANILRREHDVADLVIAQNVLGHVDDPVAFLRAVEAVLAPDGLCVVEVPSVHDLLKHCAFDTIYHEHLSYWSTTALRHAARRASLEITRVENFPDLHGGTRRYWLRRQGAVADTDEGVDDTAYRQFATQVEQRLANVQDALRDFRGERLWAYGASAKGAVMLNTLRARGNTVWPAVILDDVPEKAGLMSPGLHIPIQGGRPDCDLLWVLSWNWVDQLVARARANGYRGQFFVTHPTVRVFG